MTQRMSEVNRADAQLRTNATNAPSGHEVSAAGSDHQPESELRAVPLPPEDENDSELDEELVTEPACQDGFHSRLDKLEKQSFRMKLAVVFMVLIVGYLGFSQIVTESSLIRQTLVESRELKLLDNEGNPRLFLRMYSRVPVMQLLDTNGKPRLSLGMRFDDTPFIDLSDRTGRTRATLELTEKDEPALRLFDENGEPTFNIN